MKLPVELANHKEWTLLGPMGPRLNEGLKAYPLLGVDGGANFCEAMDLWLGDGDSFVGTVNSKHLLVFPSKKSQSDLALAFSLFHAHESMTLHCWGFLGGRRDHELFNFGEALHFLEGKRDFRIHFYDSLTGSVQVSCYGPGVWPQNHQGLFSLASLRTVNIKLEGQCEYQLPSFTPIPPLSSLGLSNTASGAYSLSADGPVMILLSENN